MESVDPIEGDDEGEERKGEDVDAEDDDYESDGEMISAGMPEQINPGTVHLPIFLKCRLT
jgi:hypothetical protein